MKLLSIESGIKEYLCYRDRVIRIDRDNHVRGLEQGINVEEMERYRPDYLAAYFDDLYLRVSDSYHAILLFAEPSEAPVFKNLYNDKYKIGDPIRFGPASNSLDGSIPPFVATKGGDLNQRYVYDLKEGRYLSPTRTSKAMLENCRYNFDWDTRKEQFLSCYDEVGRELWRIEFEGKFPYLLGEKKEGVSKLLGEYAGVLWALLQSGRVIGIRYQTGEIISDIGVDPQQLPECMRSNFSVGGFIPGSDYLRLNRKAGEIRGLSDTCLYTTVDLNEPSPTRRITDVEESMKAYGFDGLSRYFDNDNYIYFCGRNDEDKNLGVFDREKKEVVWSDIKNPISPERGHTKKIIVRDNRLYLLDFNDDLYTFELDSNGL